MHSATKMSILTIGLYSLAYGIVSFANTNISTQLTTIQLPESLAQAGTPIQLLLSKGVQVVKSKKVDTQQPDWIQIQTGTTSFPTGARHWIDKLPVLEDRDKGIYMVIPRLGVVVPIIDIPKDSSDYKKVIKGASIDYNTYLQNGIVRYPTNTVLGNTGNIVFFGHSSYWEKDPGKYKTIFASIPLLVSGDVIWVYEKQSSKEYKRYVYTIHASYETHPYDIDIMKNKGKKQITLFTCVPIGTAKNRWIVSAVIKE